MRVFSIGTILINYNVFFFFYQKQKIDLAKRFRLKPRQEVWLHNERVRLVDLVLFLFPFFYEKNDKFIYISISISGKILANETLPIVFILLLYGSVVAL